MPRPRKLTPTVRFDVRIPQDLAARMQLELYSPTVGSIPHGELSAFFVLLLRDYFRRKDAYQPSEEIPT